MRRKRFFGLILFAALCGTAGTLRAADRMTCPFADGAAELVADDTVDDIAGQTAERTAEQATDQAADQSADRAAEIVAALADAFRAMKRYAVSFSVLAGENASRGRYAVAGQDYFLTLGDAEVFGDGQLRYEVDNRRREITVDRMDGASRNILDNPVGAFDFLGSEYRSSLLWERDGRAAVRLTPMAKGSTVGHITLVVATAAMRPLSLAYDYDGERIEVVVERVEPLDEPLRRFDRKAYADYEFIDFR